MKRRKKPEDCPNYAKWTCTGCGTEMIYFGTRPLDPAEPRLCDLCEFPPEGLHPDDAKAMGLVDDDAQAVQVEQLAVQPPAAPRPKQRELFG